MPSRWPTVAGTIRRWFPVWLIPLVLALPDALRGQDVTLRLGAVDSVYSDRLGEWRRVIVRLPEDYAASGAHYPILYLLDGDAGSLLETVAAMNKLRADTFAPEVVLVAIENVIATEICSRSAPRSTPCPTPERSGFSASSPMS